VIIYIPEYNNCNHRGGELVTVIKNLKEELMSGGRDTFAREDLEWCVGQPIILLISIVAQLLQ
jgi:hypothetical protein